MALSSRSEICRDTFALVGLFPGSCMAHLHSSIPNFSTVSAVAAAENWDTAWLIWPSESSCLCKQIFKLHLW